MINTVFQLDIDDIIFVLKSLSTKELIKELKRLCGNEIEPYNVDTNLVYEALKYELKKRGYSFEIKKKIKISK